MHPKNQDDAFTLMALGILAFVVADVSHEALGHGLAVLATGPKPIILTTCYFGSAGNTSRWIPAGGGIANVVVGLGSALLLQIFRPRSPHLNYFLVLAAAFNLLFAAAYPAYSGIAAFGDWAGVISGLSPHWLWRILLVIISVGSYYASLKLIAYAVQPFCGSRHPESLARLRRITLIPYLMAMVTACLAAAFNPSGWTVIFTSGLPAAAAAFGLTQMDHFPRACSPDPLLPSAAPITRSLGWIVTAIFVLGFFIGVLGPGIRFSSTP